MLSTLKSASVYTAACRAKKATHQHICDDGHHHKAAKCKHGNHQSNALLNYQSKASLRYDHQDLKEKCACCQGGVPDGFDEAAGALSAGHHTHAHPAWIKWPRTAGDFGLAAVTAAFSGYGIYVGARNWSQAQATQRALTTSDDPTGKMQTVWQRRQTLSVLPTADAASLKVARLSWQAHKNLGSLERNIEGSVQMQRFIKACDGVLPVVTSLLMLAGLLIPSFAIAATAMQGIYCLAHVGRYLGWDLQRTRSTPRLGAWTQRYQLAQRGIKVLKSLQKSRARIFWVTSAAFTVYGTGAALLTAHALAAGPAAMLWPGLGLFLVGMAAVMYLNNGPVIKTFFDNHEAHLNRAHLGTKEATLRSLACMSAQAQKLGALHRDLAHEGLIGRRVVDRLLAWTPRWQARWRSRQMSKIARDPHKLSRRCDRVGAFMQDSWQDKHCEIQEACHSLEAQKAAFLRRCGVGGDIGAPYLVAQTRSQIDARLAALRKNPSASERLAPLGSQRPPDSTACQIAAFKTYWTYLTAQSFGEHNMRAHLYDVLCAMLPQDRRGPWWTHLHSHKGQAHQLELNPNVLAEAAASGNAQANQHLRAFCAAACSYLIYDLKPLTEQYLGILTDHLTDRAQRQDRIASTAGVRPSTRLRFL